SASGVCTRSRAAAEGPRTTIVLRCDARDVSLARTGREASYIWPAPEAQRPHAPRAAAACGVATAGGVYGCRGAAAAGRDPDHGCAAVRGAQPARLEQLDRGRAERLLPGLRAGAAAGRVAGRPLR